MYGYLTGSLSNLSKLRYLNLGYNQLKGPLTDDPQWAYLQQLEFIELMSNTISGPLPTAWKMLKKLSYVDVSYNNFTGPMLIFEAAKDLRAVEFSANDFEGDYPMAYFEKDRFTKLEYVNANFNPGVVVPEFCIRYAFCFKSKSVNK
jgi:hypothetical protein